MLCYTGKQGKYWNGRKLMLPLTLYSTRSVCSLKLMARRNLGLAHLSSINCLKRTLSVTAIQQTNEQVNCITEEHPMKQLKMIL